LIRGALILAIAASALAQAPPSKSPTSPHRPVASAELPNYRELKFPELRPIAIPSIESVTLPNGLQLLLQENHELPLVNGTVLVRTGSAFDPPEKVGLAALAVQAMLNGGTAAKPGEPLISQFQDFGADLTGQVSPNLLAISFSGLKDTDGPVINALMEGLTAPEFPQDRIDRLKARLRDAIAHRNDDGAAILKREFVRTVFGEHSPYGAQMEYANLDRINRGDLVSFHRRYFLPKNITIAMAGDFDPAVMKERLSVLFGDWKSDLPAAGAFPDTGQASAGGKFLAIKKDAKHAYFAVGGAGTGQLDPDNPALEILAGILGGQPDGRLSRPLRGGYVDELSASWMPGLGGSGLFEISGTIANPFYTPKVLGIIHDELKKIRTEEVSDPELETARAAALNRLIFAFDNPLALAPRLAEYRYFHLPGDYTLQYQKALYAVTRADVLRVAREKMDPDKLTTVVVANPTAFEAPLESLGGPVKTIDLTIPAAKPEASVGDAASQDRARELLTRAQQAEGGAGKLAAVTDYAQEIAYKFDASGAKAEMTERWMAPNYVRQDTTSAGGKISVYCDGKIGWIVSGNASGALLGVQLQQVKSNLFRTMFPLLVSDRVAGRKINAVDDQTVEISDAGNIVKIVFDKATGLPKNELYDVPVANGTVSVIETYSDYREVNGLKIPFQVAIELAGKKFQELTIKSMQINAGLKVADLERRP